MNMYS